MLKKFKKMIAMVCAVMLVIFSVGGMSASAATVQGSNAVIVNDWAYVRNSDGSIIQGRRVDIGDRVRVVEVNYNRQLAYVEYPTASGVRSGWIKNCSIIKYDYQGQYHNGSTSETVYSDDECHNAIGSLNPYESATPLYRGAHCGHLKIVYNTGKGNNTKTGYVKYNGGFNRF